MSAKDTSKGVIKWIVRPGFSKNAYSPKKAFDFRRDVMSGTKELLSRVAEEERVIAKERDQIADETESMSDSEAFDYWVKFFGHTEETIEIAQKTLKFRRYLYYGSALASMVLMYFVMPPTSFIHLIAGMFILGLFLILIGAGLRDAWRFHQVKERKMFHFLTMFENPLKFLV